MSIALRDKAPAPLHVAFTGTVAAVIRRVAAQRRENPQVLAKALLKRLIDNGFEDLLDDGRAEADADGHGGRPFGEHHLTLRQCAVLYIVGHLGGVDGFCQHSVKSIAGRVDLPETTVADILGSLRQAGLLLRGAPWKTGAPASWQLTDVGCEIHAELAGER